MAKIDVINDFEFLNVAASVGANGVNLRDDVVIVQALLHYSLRKRGGFRGLKFPVVSGAMDGGTTDMIRRFQHFIKKSPWHRTKVATDGRIDPAKGEEVAGKKRRWTILELNYMALEMWLLDSSANGGFINDMSVRYPIVGEVLSNSVGSLGLSLEPSPAVVGSLRLTLE